MRTSIKGVTPEWFTLAGEEDDPQPTRFYLQPLDGLAGVDITFLGLSGRSLDINTALVGSEVIKKAFQMGVKNWENIEDADNPGQQLAFSRKAIASIPREIIMEVGARVLEISNLSEGASKN